MPNPGTIGGGPYLDTDVFLAAWKEAHTALGIRYREPYVCRHTKAAELLSTGVHYADAAKYMGHTVEMFLRTYSEWIEEYAGLADQDDSRFEGVPLAKVSNKFPRSKSPQNLPKKAFGEVIPFKIR